jgi:serine/threonine protein kinase
LDADFELAGSYYLVTGESALPVTHSFRCLRSLNKAQFDARQASKQRRTGMTHSDELALTRPYGLPSEMSNYMKPLMSKDRDLVIGRGGASVVILTNDPRTGAPVAVKRVSASREQYLLFQEVEVLLKLRHPCVVRVFGWAPPEGPAPAEIHMEYAENRSLKDVLANVNCGISPSFWNPTGIGIIICGLVLGMRFVHSRGIIHRDLKPSNILLRAKGRVLVADFGSSQYVYEDLTLETTVQYPAPEFLQDDAKCTNKCDVFAFGLVLYEILARRPVFDQESQLGVVKRLRARDLPAIPAAAGELMSELIINCWDYDPAKRPSFKEIFRLFQTHDFAIVPEGDPVVIREYCESVLAWEQGDPIRA